MPQHHAVEVGEDRHQIGPEPVEGDAEDQQQHGTGQTQRLLADILQIHGLLFDGVSPFRILLGLVLAFGHRTAIGQATSRELKAAQGGTVDQAPEDEQVEGLDQPAGQLEGGVVVAQSHQHDQCHRCQRQGDGDQ